MKDKYTIPQTLVIIESDLDIWFFLNGQMVDERPDFGEDEYYFVSDFDVADDLHNLANNGAPLSQFMEIVRRSFADSGVTLH